MTAHDIDHVAAVAAVAASGAPSAAPGDLPPAAYLAAILSLPAVGPRRLDQLLERYRPADAWAVARRHHPDVGRDRPAVLAARHEAAGISLVSAGDADYPPGLADDPVAPHVLFVRGDRMILSGPMVAIVGTRRASAAGRELAADWAEVLTASGVSVVSGLALGIDAAAHRGALASDVGAPPVGVVGCGLDVVYPLANRALWEGVAAAGCLVSECPLGTRPEAWRFPARNRIIAGLAGVTVVVESHETGGALITAEQAAERGRTVLVVPGSLRAGVSRGTNALLRDGAGVALEVGDVLDALGMRCGPLRRSSPLASLAPAAGTDERRLWDLLGDIAVDHGDGAGVGIDVLVARSGLGLDRVCLLLDRLERAGSVRRTHDTFIRMGEPCN